MLIRILEKKPGSSSGLLSPKQRLWCCKDSSCLWPESRKLIYLSQVSLRFLKNLNSGWHDIYFDLELDSRIVLDPDLNFDFDFDPNLDLIPKIDLNISYEVDFQIDFELDFDLYIHLDLDIKFRIYLDLDLNLHIDLNLYQNLYINFQLVFDCHPWTWLWPWLQAFGSEKLC